MPFEYKHCEIEKVFQDFRTYIMKEDRPSVVGFCAKQVISKKTLYNWAKKYDELQELIDVCSTKQEDDLCTKGLDNKYNATITKLMLANHGYSDKVEHQGNSEKPIETKVHDPVDIARKMRERIENE